ncbi:MAG: formate dehydrogenase subunit gamma [Alphaproteobacteria bacterium]
MPKPESWNTERAEAVIAAHKEREGAALPVLLALQETFGFIGEEAVRLVAEALNLSRAEVHGIVTFYHDFKRRPPGRRVVKLCRAEACQSMGGDALADRVRKRLGVDWGETTTDGRVTLEPVFCLGLCACGPAGMVDERVVGRLDEAAIDGLIDEVGR